MTQGTVKWFNPSKGFGFVAPDGGGADVFIHVSDLTAGRAGADGESTLEENDLVEFEITQGRKGPRGERVHLL